MPKESDIIRIAKERFDAGMVYMSENHSEAKDDLQMLAGKNHWPADVVKERSDDGRPCLTINKLPAYTDQVKNDSRLNKMSIVVKPYGGGSTQELAQTYQGLIRSIENNSNADTAYQTALDAAADCGFGYFRIVTEWPDDQAWEQEIKISRIPNQFSVILDPYAMEADSRDKNWGFITEWVLRSDYKDKYGVDPTPFGVGVDSTWFEKERVRVAEYWVRNTVKKKLYLLSDGRTVDGDDWDSISDDLRAKEVTIHLEPNPQNPQGPPVEVKGPAPEGSGYPQGVLNPTPTIERQRVVDSFKVMQYLIDGANVLKTTEWAGKWIPVIPVWGKEIVIENERYLRGVIRFAKDPQRMYNYFRTAATETVALTPKAPWVAEERQIEDYEDDWQTANVKNIAVLKYKAVPGTSPPQRQIVTQTAIGEITESNISDGEMKATTSMYSASLGEPGNEISGSAINARKVEGDVANFTYHDNLKRAIKFAGDILIDLIPHIYDTERQVMVVDELDEEKMTFVNQTVMDVGSGTPVTINDITTGRYKCTVTAGPSFTTQRAEASASMMDFIRVAPETAKFFIDLIAENQDWPGAKKIAARIRKLLLPPDIDEKGPPAPPKPSIDDIIKQLKAQSIDLGNMKKKLGIVETQRKLDGSDQQVAEAGARGALQSIGLPGGDTDGT